MFENRLRKILEAHPFNVNKALDLSMEMHSAESHGKIISNTDNDLWGDLTQKIEVIRAKERYGCP